MTILVTGATGLLGNNIVRLLLERGHAVRVLARAGSDLRPLADLDVERVVGDVTEDAAVRQAVEGATAVFHSAGVVHCGWSRMEEHRAVNSEGTRRVAQACRELESRLIHVSTVDTLGLGTKEHPADEETPRGGMLKTPYIVTKRAGEEAVWEEIERGLQAVIIHPTYLFGPWDWKPSSGRMILEVARGFTPLAPSGGNNFCDVRDVALGALAAWERGKIGRNYILGGENLTYFDAWKLIARVTGGKAPWFRAGPLQRLIGGAAGDAWGYFTGREPDLNSAAVGLSSLPHYFSSGRAIAELNYQPRPVEQAIGDAWNWFREHGMA